MVLGSHQFSRHANQHTHGSRTHRLGRRHLACATAPLWHRPINRQWGISPRPETAIASVAPVSFRASMPRVISGGDQLSQQSRLPLTPKWCAFRGFAAKQQPGHVSLSTTSFSARRPQGRKRRGSGGGTGTSLRNNPQDAKRLRSAKRDAEPLCMSEDVPERSPRPAPGFPVGVLDLVGLSTYRRPADQR